MLEFWQILVADKQFIPHGHCYLWQPQLVGLHITSDFLIAFAYYSIPVTLVYFVRKRQDLPFNWIFLLFFIITCGTNHLMEIWTLWYPTYWLSACIKAITALVSIYTALVLIELLPKILALPNSAQLEAANQELERQISERQQAELALQEREAVLRRIGDNLPKGAIYQVIRDLDGSDRFFYISAGDAQEYSATDVFDQIADNQYEQKYGTGLGLALVKKLVEYLQGTIAVTSSENWTRFIVELPLTLSEDSI